LDWSDVELLKELLRKRFVYEAPELDGNFEDVWSRVFDPHVAAESSFGYIEDRTFLRPRDILNFTRKCIHVAVSRNHQRVEQDDIKAAEEAYSDDMLNELRYEIRDIFPQYHDLPSAFLGASIYLSSDDIDLFLMEANVPDDSLDKVRDILLWFAFLGIRKGDEEYYAYQTMYNIEKLKMMISTNTSTNAVFVIHPAFRRALSI
jgi:hypothetical protein